MKFICTRFQRGCEFTNLVHSSQFLRLFFTPFPLILFFSRLRLPRRAQCKYAASRQLCALFLVELCAQKENQHVQSCRLCARLHIFDLWLFAKRKWLLCVRRYLSPHRRHSSVCSHDVLIANNFYQSENVHIILCEKFPIVSVRPYLCPTGNAKCQSAQATSDEQSEDGGKASEWERLQSHLYLKVENTLEKKWKALRLTVCQRREKRKWKWIMRLMCSVHQTSRRAFVHVEFRRQCGSNLILAGIKCTQRTYHRLLHRIKAICSPISLD